MMNDPMKCKETYRFHDKVTANIAPFRRLLETKVEIVLLTVYLPVHIVECLAPEGSSTGDADEAIGVVQVTHGLTRLTSPTHFLPTTVTDPKVGTLLFLLRHFLFQLPRQFF